MFTRRSFFSTAGLGLAAAGVAKFSANAAEDSCAASSCPSAVTDYPYGNPADTFRLGIAGFTFVKFKLDKALQMMKKVDVHYLCIKDFHLPLTSDAAQIAAFHEQCKASDVMGYACGPIYMGSEEAAKNAFEYAKRCGVKTLVAVPFEMKNVPGKDKPQRVSSRKLLEYVDKLVKEYDIRYAIHNHGPDIPYLFPHAASAMEMIADLDKRIGLCLDIGHELRFGTNPVDSFIKYHDRVYDIHLKNVTADNKSGRGTPLPRGKIDLLAFVKALRKYRYTGMCSLEYETNMNDPIVDIAECVGYFRGLMDATR